MRSISKSTTFSELLNILPDCGDLLAKYGLHCIGCHLSPMESIEEGCKAHGLQSSLIDRLVKELNMRIKQASR